MSTPSRDPGIENEPHLRPEEVESDPTEAPAARLLRREQDKATDADHVEHTVWDEPALSAELAGEPGDDQLTYRGWLAENISRTSTAKTWAYTTLVALAAGPWALLTALAGSSGSEFGVILLTVFGPVAEEVAKVACALWVVEKRPFLFSSIGQILICGICGGFVFASIENFLYLNVKFQNPTPEFIRFRWTVCVGLHVTCSFLASIGLARIWDNAMRNQHRPRIALGIPWMVIAMVGHGLYNFTALVATKMGWLDFLGTSGS